MACAEMFRRKPERVVSSGAGESGDAGVSVVASDAFSARLRASRDAEGDAESAARRNAGKEENASARFRHHPAMPPYRPPPNGDDALRDVFAPVCAAPRRGRSRWAASWTTTRVWSACCSPASASTKTVGSLDARSKLFVVTTGGRAGDYVTYSCGG